MTEFLSASNLGRMVGQSSDVVRYDMRTGRLVPAARTASGAALFTKEQAEKWAANRLRVRDARRDGAAA